jgi:hypothetical protein
MNEAGDHLATADVYAGDNGQGSSGESTTNVFLLRSKRMLNLTHSRALPTYSISRMRFRGARICKGRLLSMFTSRSRWSASPQPWPT